MILPTLIDSDIEDLPAGIRVVAGIFQSTAVRAAGFGIVPLNSLAPAVKVLYVIMRKSSTKLIVFTRTLLIGCFLIGSCRIYFSVSHTAVLIDAVVYNLLTRHAVLQIPHRHEYPCDQRIRREVSGSLER